MEEIKMWILSNVKSVLVVGILLLIGAVAYFYIDSNNKLINEEIKEVSHSVALVTNEEKEPNTLTTINVDIKGAVNKPGVYTVASNSIVNDIIKIAGGLKSNASTQNINLSKKIMDETVIIIYTKTEIKNAQTTPVENTCKCDETIINDCLEKQASVIETKDSDITSSSNSQAIDKKVSINTATKEQLMDLSGIGESKAEAIITYRTNSGLFTKIEDIMNVSGIGESIFDKIKNSIII